MEEDFVSALLRKSEGPQEQHYRGVSGTYPVENVYSSRQNLGVPEISGAWSSTLDILSDIDPSSIPKTKQPRWMHDTEYAVIAYCIYGCLLLVLACIVTALLVVFETI